jgi:dTDP-4-amino-4,6-dideoxygalactose transaminase
MFGLIPAEYHYYSLRDAARGLAASRKRCAEPAAIILPGVGEGIAIRSARAAVIIALKALGLPPGSRIGIPLYCCPVVFKAIKAAGCFPAFIDIDPGSHCLSVADLRAKRSRLDAVIAVHMFGNLCDMPAILEIMAGRPVIEDCAQSLGSKLDGRACGVFGDLAFFSFRSGKYLAVGEGAALYAKDPDLRARVRDLTEALPVPSRADEIKHVITSYIRSTLRSRPWWGLVGSKIWAAYNKTTDFADKSPIVVGRMFSSDLATLHRRLPGLESMIASQKDHAAYLGRHLRLGATQLPVEQVRADANRFMYPAVFNTMDDRKAMAAYLRRHGIGTATPYEDTAEGAAKNYGYEGDCPVAEQLLKRTLVIPSFYALRTEDIEHIVRSANDGWALITMS